MTPPIAIAVVISPKPTSSIPSRSAAYSTNTDHAAPYVTLNATIVSASVRIGGWARSQRTPSARSARKPARRTGPSGSGCDRSTTREISTAPNAKHTALVAKGSAMPAANSTAPIGGASSWFVSRNAPSSRALAIPRSSRRTSRGTRLLLPTSAKVSAVPSTNSASSTTPMLTVPLAIVQASTARTTARARSTAATIRRRSKRSAIPPATIPNTSFGSVCARSAIETSSGSRV